MQVKVIGAAVLVLGGLGAGLGAWVHMTFGGAASGQTLPGPAVVAEPVATVASAQGPLAAPTGAGAAPQGLVLAGTHVDGSLGSATFLVGGELRPVLVGGPLGASSWVLRRVGPASAWVSDGAQGPEHEIAVRTPRELSPLMAEGRQDRALPPGLGGQAGPAQALATLRDVQGLAVPEEQQVRVRRRDGHRAGPVGSP